MNIIALNIHVVVIVNASIIDIAILHIGILLADKFSVIVLTYDLKTDYKCIKHVGM